MKQLIRSATIVICASVTCMLGFGSSIASAQSINHQATYAALGDSVAAGLGLHPSSTNPLDVACGRSDQSYPYLVAAALHMQLNHLACSGAAVRQGLYESQQVGNTALPPQIDQAFATGNSKLITMTIGANDVGWDTLLEKCYTVGCGSAQDSAAIQAAIFKLRLNLFVALTDIRSYDWRNPPKTLLTGYYSGLSNVQPVCADTYSLTAAEITWINNEEAKLNAAIRQTTELFGFAHYVPLNFTGHELCSADPWVQGLQSTAPFHPTAEGQVAIAKSILSAVRH